MKRKEESHFIIPYQLLYGKVGCEPRIKKEADCLFVIQLLNFVAVGVADATENVSAEDKRKYSVMIGKILEVKASAIDSFRQGSYVKAASAFHRAIDRLEMCQLNDQNEENDQREHLIKLYVNAMTCYNKMDKPAKACNAYKDLSRLTDTTKHPKALFQYGKALIALGDYVRAKDVLTKAHRLKPSASEIVEQMKNLEVKHDRHKKIETNLWRKAFGNEQEFTDLEGHLEVSEIFKKSVNESIMRFKDDVNASKMTLPYLLSFHEKAYIRDLIEESPMKMVIREVQGIKTCHLTKVSK